MHVDTHIHRLHSGATVHCRIWSPTTEPAPDEAILLLHGVESHSAWFEEIAPPLTHSHFSVWAVDRPGWGASPGPRGHLASYDDALSLLEELGMHLRERHRRVHLAGLSWGGKLALYAALRRPLLFDSVSLMAPGLVPRISIPWTAKARIAADLAFGRGRAPISLPIRVQDFTAHVERQDFIRTDNARVKEVTSSFCLESLKMDRFIQEHIAQLRVPTQLLLAEADAIIDNDATRGLFAQAGERNTRVSLQAEAAHSLVFERPDETAAALADWARQPPAAPPDPWHVVIMGAGAVGSAVGGLLAWGGHAVTLVGRQSHVEAIRKDGLSFGQGGTTVRLRQNITAVSSPSEIPSPPHLILLCVKSFDTEAALAELAPALTPETVLLSLQNGIRNEARVRSACPAQPILAGAICAYLHLDGPGVVTMPSDKGGIALGPFDAPSAAALATTAALLRDTGLQIFTTDNGASVKWSKLMLNGGFNAINALTGLGTSAILSHPDLGPLAVKTFAECREVMAAQGIPPMDLPGYPVTRLARAMRLPTFLGRRLVAWFTRREATGTSSMAQDLARARLQTEIDEINGAVVRAGEAHGLATPANRHLQELVHRAVKDAALARRLRTQPAAVAAGWQAGTIPTPVKP